MLALSRTSVAVLVALQAAAGLASSLPPAAGLESRDQGYVNMVYWPSWDSRDLSDVDPGAVTHIMYAFGQALANGSVVLRDPVQEAGTAARSGDLGGKWAQLFKFKQTNPRVKTLLSIGGFINQDEEKPWFASAASSSDSRKVFVDTATQLMLDGGFDGLDVDWEYPTGEKQAEDHASLMEGLRARLNDLGKAHDYRFLLTLAISPSPFWHKNLLFSRLGRVVDFWYVMAYDYAGGWLSVLQHHANVYPRKDAAVPEFSTQQGIESLRSFGVDPSKMVLGLPAYAKVLRNLAQLGDPMTRDNDVGPQSIRSLMKEPGWVITCDKHLVACQGINQETHRFATLDTAETIAAKAEYAKGMGLAGTFLWALNHDLPGKDGLYIAAAKALSRLERSPSLQYYPDSCFDNVRGEAERRKPVSTSVSILATGPIDTGLPTSAVSSEWTPAASAESNSVRQWRNGTSSVCFSTSAPATVSPGKAAPTGPAGGSTSSGSQTDNIQCDDCAVSDYMTSAIDAVGMAVKVVCVVLVTDVTVACPDKVACGPASRVSLTKAAFATACPLDVEPPTATVSVTPGAGVEPIPVEVAGRDVDVCATELGCRATGIPGLPGAYGAPAPPASDGSGPGKAPSKAYHGPESGEAAVASAGKNQTAAAGVDGLVQDAVRAGASRALIGAWPVLAAFLF